MLDRIRRQELPPPVIMITAYATVETSIQALRKGAYDMLIKPFEPEELLHRVRNALKQNELMRENRELRDELAEREKFSDIIGESRALMLVLETASKVAERDFPILITGDSGTGKELVAQAIHRGSTRRGRKFVAINCGALPQSLLESELFGVAQGRVHGRGRRADGLFSRRRRHAVSRRGREPADERPESAPALFPGKGILSRRRHASPTKVDVRIVAATNADIEEEVKEGTFREDLYYRLGGGAHPYAAAARDAPRTSRFSRPTSCANRAGGSRPGRRLRGRRAWTRCVATPGRATSANSRT